MFTLTLALPLLLSGPTVSSTSTPVFQEAGVFAIRAAHLHLENGTVLEKGIVLVDGSRIAAVGGGVNVPEGVPLIEHDGHLSAGLIALFEHSGGGGELRDSTRTTLTGGRLAHAFQPGHSQLKALLKEGITSAVLAPRPGALSAGCTAVVKVAGQTVVSERAQLHVGLSSSSLLTNRRPTSYAGALRDLGALLTEGKGDFGDAARGTLPVLIEAGARHEVQRAVGFAVKHNLKGAISGAPLAGELAHDIAAAGLSVICPPLSPGTSGRTLDAVLALADAGVPFGFGVTTPYLHPHTLRMGAAMCVRRGLRPAAALRALTGDAARIAGVADRIGTVAAGRDADLVLWSGPPADLTSSVQAVLIDGQLVYGEL
jgi:imidazolonepropionase-like amidohydrolase